MGGSIETWVSANHDAPSLDKTSSFASKGVHGRTIELNSGAVVVILREGARSILARVVCRSLCDRRVCLCRPCPAAKRDRTSITFGVFWRAPPTKPRECVLPIVAQGGQLQVRRDRRGNWSRMLALPLCLRSCPKPSQKQKNKCDMPRCRNRKARSLSPRGETSACIASNSVTHT